MTKYGTGYLKALKDLQTTTSGMFHDPGISSDGRTELKRVVAYIEILINKRRDRPDEAELGKDAPGPLCGSF